MSPNFRPILFGLKVRTSEDCTKDWRFRYVSLAPEVLRQEEMLGFVRAAVLRFKKDTPISRSFEVKMRS